MKIKHGYVYYCKLPNMHNDITSGYRPCLVISNNHANEYSSVVTVVPMTTKHRRALPTHVIYKWPEGVLSTIYCEQIMTISKESFVEMPGFPHKLPTPVMIKVENALSVQLQGSVYYKIYESGEIADEYEDIQ